MEDEKNKARKEQMKKFLVYSGIALLFGLVLMMILKPLFNKEEGEKEEGLQVEIQDPTTGELERNKLKVYEGGDAEKLMERSYRDALRMDNALDSLSEGDLLLREREQQRTADEMIHRMISNQQDLSRLEREFTYIADDDALREEQLKNDRMEQELIAIRDQLALERKKNEDMKSLQSQLMQGAVSEPSKPDTTVTLAQADLPEVELVNMEHDVVSSLSRGGGDSSLSEGEAGRNAFISIGKSREEVKRNTLKAVVSKTTTLRNGDYVQLRLLEPVRFHDVVIPRNTTLVARSSFQDKRMRLEVNSVEYKGKILKVSLLVFDMDGQEGIHVPETLQSSLATDMTTAVAESSGTSFTFSQSAKDQLLTDLSRGVLQGAARSLGKRVTDLKVTLKAGYKVLLVSTK